MTTSLTSYTRKHYWIEQQMHNGQWADTLQRIPRKRDAVKRLQKFREARPDLTYRLVYVRTTRNILED